MPDVKYNNLLSRLLLRRHFERQTLTPPSFSLLKGPLWLFEKALMRVDSSKIAIDRPIFIVGNARSGTTMLQDILCSHPEMAFFTNAMNEFPSCFCAAEFFRRLLRLDVSGERYQKDGVQVGAGTPSEGNDLWRHVLKPSSDIVPGMHLFKMEDLSDSQIQAIHTMLRNALWSFGSPAKRFLNKTMELRFLVSLLQELYPDCRVVHIVRDPRQCANSIVKMMRMAAEHQQRVRKNGAKSQSAEKTIEAKILEASRYWNSMITFMRKFKTRANHLLEVRYEDILAQPRHQIEVIREFCELPEVPDQASPYWKQIEQVGQVKQQKSYSHFKIIESICAKNMANYGY